MAEENTPALREGLVNQVCREWLIHEDSALAHRLQEKEIEEHYGQNRSQRRLIGSDLKQAKVMQTEEEEEIETLRRLSDDYHRQQEEEDAELAMRIQDELEREVKLRQRSIEEADKELARKIQEKEKNKLQQRKLEKELRQVAKARVIAESSWEPTKCGRQQLASNYEDTLSRALTSQCISNDRLYKTSVTDSSSDLTDLCIQPSPGMSDEEVRRLQEEQDAELARLMQEQETKRRSQAARDRQMAIEAQDRELAKLLQEKERAKARKAREKAKLKAQQRQLAEQNCHNTSLELTGNGPDNGLNGGDFRQESERTESPCCGSHMIRPSVLDLQTSTSQSPSRARTRSSSPSSTLSSYLPPRDATVVTHTNVAMAIDPTYSRRAQQQNHYAQLHHQHPAENHCDIHCEANSGGSTPVLPTPVGIRTGIPVADQEFYESDEDPAPPYMPIQGQKRTCNLDKKKKKEGKESCKQQ